MHVDDCRYKRGEKTYRRVWLRHTYREAGKVKHHNIANITSCSDAEIEAIKWALRNKGNPEVLEQLENSKVVQDRSVGAVIALYQVMEQLGIIRIIGNGSNAPYILWLIMARLLDPGSRLSAVRLCRHHYGCQLLGISHINEQKLYEALSWLYTQKQKIETRTYKQWEKTSGQENNGNHLFLSDVTSSYFEGNENELSAYGYNRDRKKGKKQLVYGLLTDKDGYPLAVEVFKGNTQDVKTVNAQIEKLKNQFQCSYVTLVGDKGMLKTAQIETLNEAKLNYITSITKPQIEKLIKRGVFQLELFTDELCQIIDSDNDVRYILRRNPARAEEIHNNRSSKIEAVRKRLQNANGYLTSHPRVHLAVQKRKLNAYIIKLCLGKVVMINEDEANQRQLELMTDDSKLEEMSKLDGCYVIKTDLPPSIADKELVHSRYKDLKHVEWAFRTEKSQLNVRPIYLRKADRTIAHLMITMFAYIIERHLRGKWADMDITVKEGIHSLTTLMSSKITIGNSEVIKIPGANQLCAQLLERANVKLPEILPDKEVIVATQKKLQSGRK